MGMEWPEKAKRPGDGGTMGAARLKVGDLAVVNGTVSAGVGSGSDWKPVASLLGSKTGGVGPSGNGLTSRRSELAAPWGPLVSAVAKLAAGRACMRVVRTVSRTKSCTKLGWRKRTSVLAGWTLTSTSCGGISRKSRTTGKLVGGRMLR